MSRSRSKDDDDSSSWLAFAIGAAVSAALGALGGYLLHKELTSSTPVPASTTPSEQEIKSFICPITQELMRDPWSCPNCQCFEKTAIVDWLRKCQECPMCRQPLRVEDLRPNLNLRNAIEEYRHIHNLR